MQFKQLTKILISLLFSTSVTTCFALEINQADVADLDSIKGIGPSLSLAIIKARKQDGPFKDWADFEARVKGAGKKKSAQLSNAGLTVNGRGL